jgi:Family of unknown function (DUF6914)
LLILSRYHWAVLVGPKETDATRGTRYHANERLIGAGRSEWFFEEREASMKATSVMLVRILVGKVESTSRLEAILRRVPIRQGETGWNRDCG